MQIDDSRQQIIDLINSGTIETLLITSGKNDDPDAIGSMLALAAGLASKIPTIQLAVEDFDASKYAFFEEANQIQNSIGSKSLVVSIDMGQNPIEKINYNSQDSRFNLILTPKMGQLDVDQIEYSYTGITFDAIITVDTAKKSLLGQWVTDFASELADIPLVNLDHHPDNEQFGTLNYIKPDYPAATLVVHELLQALNIDITPQIATYMLIGLLSDTSGFANSNADANALRQAAKLIDRGANLHQAMAALFRNMTLPSIHLWGAVLSRVTNEEPGIILTYLTQEDSDAANATEADIASLGSLVNNVLVSERTAKVAVMLKEKGNGEISGSLRSIDDTDVAAIARTMGGGGHRKAAGFRLTDTTMEQAKQDVLKAIRQALPVGTTQAPSPSEH